MSKYPQQQLDSIDSTDIQEIVTSLKSLYDLGKPQTDDEIEQRINEYFEFIANSSLRPGIESISMALHISRQTFFNWSKGIGCSSRCQELIQCAKAVINSFIEQAMLQGKINPASGIFLCKNWLNYKDTVSLEENTATEGPKRALSISDLKLLKLGGDDDGV